MPRTVSDTHRNYPVYMSEWFFEIINYILFLPGKKIQLYERDEDYAIFDSTFKDIIEMY